MGPSMLQLWRILLLILPALASPMHSWEIKQQQQQLDGVGRGGGGGGGGIDPTSFYFTDFEENLQDLSLLGDAKFVRIEGQADGMAVQLSGTRRNTVGRLLYSLPVNMLDLSSGKPASFSTFFEFSMAAFAGDGLAFVLVPDKVSIGASGPWLGLVKLDEISNTTTMAPHTFAVEFDSVMNMELRDPNSNHVGVDVETIVSTVTANASDIGLILNDGSKTYAWIRFDGSTSELEVRISKDAGEMPEMPLLSHKLDHLGSVLKPWMYAGFSSSTGEASQKHKIFSWKFSSGSSANFGSGSLSSERWRGEDETTADMRMVHSLPANPDGLSRKVLDGDNRVHSFPANPLVSPSSAEIGDHGDVETKTKTVLDLDDPWVILAVGFTCGASVTLFLVAGWALMRSRFDRDGYEEIS